MEGEPDKHAGDELRKIADDLTWYEPDNPSTHLEQCPCCDYISLPERFSYLICPICFWEDDGIDVDRLDSTSGPNHMTLRQGRANFLAFGACDTEMLKNVLPVSNRSAFQHRPRTP